MSATVNVSLSEALDNLLKVKAELRAARASERAEKLKQKKEDNKAKAAKLRAVKAQIRALMKAHNIKVEDLVATETVH